MYGVAMALASLIRGVLTIIVMIFVFSIIAKTVLPRSKGGRTKRGRPERNKVLSWEAAVEQARMDAASEGHDGAECKYTYAVGGKSDDFSPRRVVDEFAILRAKNEKHERHLREMAARK